MPLDYPGGGMTAAARRGATLGEGGETQLNPLSVSIILEWETGEEAGWDRAARCLREINRQMWEAASDFRTPPEFVLALDPEEGARAAAAAVLRGLTWPGGFVVAEPEQPIGYYEKKNFGFSRSSGDIVLFVDSDLAPESSWMRAMIHPFEDAAKSVVVGRTHFDTATLYQRAIALFWIFDTRIADDLVRPTRRLVSNNIAFRRQLFAALPFPGRPTYRGQCSELGARLSRLGIVMYEATGARASHPAARSAASFVERAFHAGRDAFAYRAMEGPVGAADWRAEWRRDRAAVRTRRLERAPAIGAGMASRAAAAVLGQTYYAIKAVGYLASLRRSSRQASSRSGSAPKAAV
jgi:hypothetical protein